ncbi:uncharacterized protein SOCE836_097350 [Sorangium cellulosum]|uniref:Uncharacterized protein n=1 Tax=Sorangium cellulosum TaxID=56 RepID=A0A4P2R3B1_SORCE|nr:uncharacterized protein SOCE836_097350 [Sorangium cellulosum]
MANVLPAERRLEVLAALVNGTTIRSTERMTGVHRDTIGRFAQAVGEGCARLHDRMVRDLTCALVDLDEQHSWCGPPPLPSTPPTAPGGRDGTEKEEGVHARVQGGGGTAGEGERPEHRPGGEGPRPDRDGAARLDQARGHRRGPRPAGGADDAGA